MGHAQGVQQQHMRDHGQRAADDQSDARPLRDVETQVG
jgi:hypothetical protein